MYGRSANRREMFVLFLASIGSVFSGCEVLLNSHEPPQPESCPLAACMPMIRLPFTRDQLPAELANEPLQIHINGTLGFDPCLMIEPQSVAPASLPEWFVPQDPNSGPRWNGFAY